MDVRALISVWSWTVKMVLLFSFNTGLQASEMKVATFDWNWVTNKEKLGFEY